MRIELQPPFTEYKSAHLLKNREGRKIIILYASSMNRTTISYARFLMSVHMGRVLKDDEHVDHIDNDKTNDSIENLQILTPAQNTKKSAKGRTYRVCICPVCKINFFREARNTTNRINCFCSKACRDDYRRGTKQCR